MQARWLLTIAAAVAVAAPVNAQTFQRRAVLTGGGGPDVGRCTMEVIVDGSAEVEIRGDEGMLRDVSGQRPEWRRFECTGVMPANPTNIRFTANGRGRAQLVRDPRYGGGAVVRIDDPEPGAQIYHIELFWNGSQFPARSAERDREMNHRYTAEQAVQACQDAVRRQAVDRFQTQDIEFRRIAMDDTPGRRDWVVGTLEVHRGYGPEQHYRFSCSVNFDNGRIRSAMIEPTEGNYEPQPSDPHAQAMQNCRREVVERLRTDGYDEATFGSINIDNRRGRNDWIVGTVRAQGPDHPESFDFSCSVDLDSGNVRTADLQRR